jgi:adenylosuccinate lyase
LALTQAGMSREAAYKLVQSNAMAVWGDLQKNKPASFPDRLKKDKTIAKYLKPKMLAECFDNKFYIRHAKDIWKRVKAVY